MRCDDCNDEILPEDTRYEQITPIEGGGKTIDSYCSIACLNEDVGFTDEEIESLMRQAGYEIPPDYGFEWAVHTQSFMENMDRPPKMDDYHLVFEHTKRNFDIEIRHIPLEELYEVALYTYEMENGEKIGLEDIAVERTGIFQRALGYAESYMERVAERKV